MKQYAFLFVERFFSSRSFILLDYVFHITIIILYKIQIITRILFSACYG